MLKTPKDSKITITDNFDGITVIIPQEKKATGHRIFSAVSSIIGLLILSSFFRGIFDGPNFFSEGSRHPFFILWASFMTFVGFMFLWQTYRTIRPAVPITLKLQSDQLYYDSGIVPYIPPPRHSRGLEAWQKLFTLRSKKTFDYEVIETIRFKDFKDGNRLTIDHNGQRTELAPGISEIDREWLYRALRDHYRF